MENSFLELLNCALNTFKITVFDDNYFTSELDLSRIEESILLNKINKIYLIRNQEEINILYTIISHMFITLTLNKTFITYTEFKDKILEGLSQIWDYKVDTYIYYDFIQIIFSTIEDIYYESL